MQNVSEDIYLPRDAEIVARTQESETIFTLTVKFIDPKHEQAYQFQPGQFNMMYLYGVGEVPISIVSDPEQDVFYAHTIRRVGRVTQGLSLLNVGDHVGIRGPFGRGWPLEISQGKDILIMTGGLGCAPSVSIIHYMMKRRDKFGRLNILQGVKHSDDLIYRQHYASWAKMPNTTVKLAADVSKPNWPGHTGLITELIEQVDIDANKTMCLMCGPEAMMIASAKRLIELQLAEKAIYLSLERNMECAIGHCGHCQLGGKFICKDGPIFCYSDMRELLGKKGF